VAVKRIVPDTDIMALLPVQERDPVLQQSFSHMVDSGAAAPGRAGRRRRLGRCPARRRCLQRDAGARKDLFEATPINEQTQNDMAVAVPAASPDAADRAAGAQLREQPAQFWLDAALAKLYAPFGGPKLGSWQEDPFGLFSGWVQERAQETPVRPRDGHLFVADTQRQYVLLP
jgi:predicted exporter